MSKIYRINYACTLYEINYLNETKVTCNLGNMKCFAKTVWQPIPRLPDFAELFFRALGVNSENVFFPKYFLRLTPMGVIWENTKIVIIELVY